MMTIRFSRTEKHDPAFHILSFSREMQFAICYHHSRDSVLELFVILHVRLLSFPFSYKKKYRYDKKREVQKGKHNILL